MMTISKLWNLLLEQIWLLARFSFTRLHVGRPLKGGLEALHFTLHLGGGPGAQTPPGLFSSFCEFDSTNTTWFDFLKFSMILSFQPSELFIESKRLNVNDVILVGLQKWTVHFFKFGVTFLFVSAFKLSEMKLWLRHKGTFIIHIHPSQFPSKNRTVGIAISVNTQWTSLPKFTPQTTLCSFSLVL